MAIENRKDIIAPEIDSEIARKRSAGGIAEVYKAINANSVSTAVVATLFGCTGPVLILIGAAEAGQLSKGQTVAWLFSTYFLGGIISIGMSLRYRQPICGAWSIPGAAILIAALSGIQFSDAVGAFILSGMLVLILGLSGLISKLMRLLPMPIVMAMVAGALIRFGTEAVNSIVAEPIVAGLATVVYFLVLRYVKTVPPVLAAGVVGFVAAFSMGLIQPTNIDLSFIAPVFTSPTFSFDAFLAISIPLAVLVIGAENAQATGILLAEGYRPPINAMTVISGAGGILAGLLGGHNANIAGPMTAICASPESGDDISLRYGSSLLNGLCFVLFGLVAGVAVPIILALPKTLILCIAGLAMINVLLTSFQQAFNKVAQYQMGAFVALIVAMSGQVLYGVSAPFWALIAGVMVSTVLNEGEKKSDG